jgi:multiple sugar transport system permease protein
MSPKAREVILPTLDENHPDLDDFFGPLIYINDINNDTVQLGLRTFVDSTGKSDWGGLFAMSVVTLIPVFFFFFFFQRLLIEGIATTGMKG